MAQQHGIKYIGMRNEQAVLIIYLFLLNCINQTEFKCINLFFLLCS